MHPHISRTNTPEQIVGLEITLEHLVGFLLVTIRQFIMLSYRQNTHRENEIFSQTSHS